MFAPFSIPQKNNAFFLWQAYSYLSDDIKRRDFNLERSKRFCIKCNRIPYAFSNNLSKSQTSKAVEELKSSNRARLLRNRVREMKQRFNEEINVMENCLRANSLPRKETPLFKPSENYRFQSNTRWVSQKAESPVFDPSNYLFKGYPHIRNRIYKRPESFPDLKRGDMLNKYGGHGKGRSYNDFPVFEMRSDGGMLKESASWVYS
ncbi:CHAPERONE DNAJ-DOMAIN SUPERFAMILY PROTEIN [Salix koriyanagi]|uniref:CHAPERONE DNAJ-DOMAIN SUPERFAMILY PROTEIN n=1 Tax=Salix koriyanagi TaxID=2511006 RepID=A0A9Q1AGV3_9ROSI|nr:CHAPERONE DNAJ-DOMAIN SUPERFAMILY PROTEIN [Salix koriyanagi]